MTETKPQTEPAPTTPTPPKLTKLSEQQTKEMLKNWRDLCELSKKRERTLLELLRHPEATIEQIDEARKLYAVSYKRLKETQQQLIAAYQTGRIYNSFRITMFLDQTSISLRN